MIGLLAAAILAVAPHGAREPVILRCSLLGPSGEPLAPEARLVTGRHDRRFAVGGGLFLDMRYDALAAAVTVTVVRAPRAPWSFGETVVQGEQRLDIRGPGPGHLRLGPTGVEATLACAGA